MPSDSPCCLKSLANILIVRIQERSERTIYIAQADLCIAKINDNVIGAYGFGSISNRPGAIPRVVQSKEADHIILINSVAGYTNTAN